MFILEKKHPIETDIIIDILKSEKIPYKLTSIKHYDTPWNEPRILGYNIEIHSDLEHFDYAQTLIKKRIKKINKLNAIFNKSIEDNMTLTINNNETKVFTTTVGTLEVSEYKPKKQKSFLKSIIEWIIMEFECLSKKL